MKRIKVTLILSLVVCLTLGLSCSSFSSPVNEEIPEILQLNPSLNFDKEAIKKWVEDHSWEEAFNLVSKASGRLSKGPEKIHAYVTLVTPVYLWTQAYSKISWSEGKKKEEYRNALVKPTEGAAFACIMYANDKEKLKQNLQFFLEVDDRFWKASNVYLEDEKVEIEEINGVVQYRQGYLAKFDFTDMEGHPKWTKWTFYLIRKDLMEDFVWDFE